jgi:ribonuclease HI
VNSYIIISDGACSGNPGPGGWGMILVTPDLHVREFGGSENPSTNNRMELTGLLEGLRAIWEISKTREEPKRIRIISDSKYVLDNAKVHARNWAKRDWTLASGDPVKNQEIWERVLKGLLGFEKRGFSFEYELVKGHSGNEANERADQIAVKFSRGESIKLYDGPMSGYTVSIQTGPPFKPVYLSYVSGKLTRHPNWAECQLAVEGKPGARFKKVKNSLEERETLKSWGLA